ncbi:hypothetical protein ACIQC9_13665 [Brevundimonas sp. NPDC092305]
MNVTLPPKERRREPRMAVLRWTFFFLVAFAATFGGAVILLELIGL